MTQARQRFAHRRADRTDSATFTFWYRRPHAASQVSAWMLDRSGEEAAFLTSASDAPRVGERLELAQSETAGLGERDCACEAHSQLPRFGRVVRLDELQGATRRVAIRFEPPSRSPPLKTGK